jgi:hypothetical protein
MAEPSKSTAVATPPDREKPEPEESKVAARDTFLSRLLTKELLGFLLVVSLLSQAAGLVYCRVLARRPVATPPPEEVSLGSFRFQGDAAPGVRIAGADFTVHVTLLESVEQTARRRLTDRKCRVRQAIEEILRKAHSSDFEDPSLGDVRRLMQEQVNQILGIRAVADIIVTDLRVALTPTGR